MEELMSKKDIIDLCNGQTAYDELNLLQVREIISGRVNGLRKDEIDRYSNPNFTYIEMRNEKERLLREAEPNCMLQDLKEYLMLVSYYLKKLMVQDMSLKTLYGLFNDERNKYNYFGYNKHRKINVILESDEDVINNLYALAYAGYLCSEKEVKKIKELKEYVYRMK